MKKDTKRKDKHLLQIEDLRTRLEEAEEILRAIRKGEVDALVVSGPQGDQAYTLKGAEQPYRVFVETMSEGAVTLGQDGTILYCNNRFGELLKEPIERIIGSEIVRFIAPTDTVSFESKFQRGKQEGNKVEISLKRRDGQLVPVYLSFNPLMIDEVSAVCMVVTDLTEQKRNEEILKAERLARSILDQATEAIVICDRTGQIIRVSQMAHELSNKNLLFQNFDSIFSLHFNSEGNFKSSKFTISAPLNGEVLQAIEVSFRRDDGKVLNLLLSARPLLRQKDTIYGCVVTLVDITERKQTEESLIQSEAKFRILADNTYDMEFWINPEGYYVFVSPSCKRITGHGPDEFMENPGLRRQLIHPEDLPIFDTHLQKQEKEEETTLQEIQFRIIRPDGSIHWIGHVCQRIFDEEGRFLGIRGTNRDITERKWAEDALRQSEERLRLAQESGNIGIWDRHPQTGETSFSPQLNKIYGLAEGTLQRYEDWVQRVHPDDILRVENERDEAIARRKPFDLEFRIFHSSGEIRWINAKGGAICNEAGEIVRVLGVNVDITERKRADAALNKSKQRLELLSETASKLLTTDRPQEVVNELCQKVMTYLDCHVFINYLVDEENQRLHLNAYAGISEDAGKEIEWLDYGVAVCGCAARDACQIVAEDIPNTPDPRTELVKSFGIKAYACHPLLSAGRVIGTLSFGTRSRTTFSEEDLSLMKTVADQVAIAMERISLIEALRKSRDELEIRVHERTATLAKLNEALKTEIVERKRTADALKAERQRFNDVLEMLPAYLVLLAPDYHVPFANRFFRDRFGESNGRRCFEYLFGRCEPCEVCETYTVLKTKTPHEWEWTGPDGHDYSVFDFLFTDTDGSPLILEMGIDITERKQAEEQLKAANQYTRSLIEVSLDPLVTISRDGKIMDVNRATELVTGVPREQIIGSDFSSYFTEPEKAKEGYKQVFTMESVRDYPLAIRHVSGKVIDVLYNASLYRDETGGVQGVFAAARDITKRKRAQEALRQSEELLRNVLELLPVGVWITDKNGVITQGNPAGQKIWAGSRYVGIDQYGEYKGWWLDTGKRIEPEEWGAARAIMKGEISLNEEIEIECFDGTHKIILNSAIPLRNEKNEIIGSIIINDDITERKRTEKALRQMQKMEALGTLAGGIAHDFNNILMPIGINTELALLDTPENSPVSNCLKLVQEAANRGKDLIKQIITFSRQKEQVKAPIEIGPVIKEALKFLRSSIPKNIEIREHIEVAPSMIIADPTQIHQVLMNICSNASYAMREKGGILDVSLMPVEVDVEMVNRHLDLKPGPYLRLTVADTGGGMDKEIMEKIFDPFFTTKKPGEGTGMGLAVVHGIVKNHGGAITVYSEVGKGSTFNVFLPQIKESLKTEVPVGEPILTGKERILLIDDEEIQIRSVQTMLERLGYQVIGKTDALEALEAFKEQSDAFDLIITDQTMPHLTGRDLAEKILSIRPDIPIILCTGFSEVIHEEEAKAIGIREFIMKPFSLNEMARIIRQSLERNG